MLCLLLTRLHAAVEIEGVPPEEGAHVLEQPHTSKRHFLKREDLGFEGRMALSLWHFLRERDNEK